MTYPIGDVVATATVVVALGAGAVFVIPAEKPPRVPTAAERVDALQRQVLLLVAEQRRLAARVKTETARARERKRP